MENQKTIFFLDKAQNQPSSFRTKSWVEINSDSSETYTANSHIKFKPLMLKRSNEVIAAIKSKNKASERAIIGDQDFSTASSLN